MAPHEMSIIQTFNDINEGKYTNALFSGTEVVMVSKKLYDTLLDAWEDGLGLAPEGNTKIVT